MLEESKQHSPEQYMSSGSGEENAALCNSQTKGARNIFWKWRFKIKLDAQNNQATCTKHEMCTLP